MKASDMEARGSKTLVSGDPMKEPSWAVWTFMKTVRVLLLTLLWTGLGMGAGLFCGIVGILLISAFKHSSPDMSMAYRSISVPLAVLSGSCAFLWNLFRAVQGALQRRRARP